MKQTDKYEIKKILIAALEEKRDRYADMVESLQASRNDDTKSSAGDKFETGREMVQREIDRVHGQYDNILRDLGEISRVDVTQHSDSIGLGSLVLCSSGVFFMSIGYGKVQYKEEKVYAISMGSPLGRLLLGKTQGASVSMNDRRIDIWQVL